MDDELLSRVVRLAREPVDADPAAEAQIAAAVRASRARRRHPLLAPRLSYTFACVLALATFAAGAWLRGARESRVTQPGLVSDTTPVTFVLVAEHAHDVAVVGDFNDWTPGATRLRQQRGGVWSVVVPLPPGRYSYAFIVDGVTWLADPTALPNADEDFGRPGSIVLVERGGS